MAEERSAHMTPAERQAVRKTAAAEREEAETTAYVRRVVAEAPLLTERQRERLSMLLRPGVITAHHQLRAQSRSLSSSGGPA